jgi:hypothetical protein
MLLAHPHLKHTSSQKTGIPGRYPSNGYPVESSSLSKIEVDDGIHGLEGIGGILHHSDDGSH